MNLDCYIQDTLCIDPVAKSTASGRDGVFPLPAAIYARIRPQNEDYASPGQHVRFLWRRRSARRRKILSPVSRRDFRSVHPPAAPTDSAASARAIATRCCSPPDSSPARWCPRLPTVRLRSGFRCCAHAGRARAANQQRHHHVFRGGELGQQVVLLPDVADLSIARTRKAAVRKSL